MSKSSFKMFLSYMNYLTWSYLITKISNNFWLNEKILMRMRISENWLSIWIISMKHWQNIKQKKTCLHEIELQDLWQETACDNMMFWTMTIRIWRINISCENSNKLQEFAVLHDHEAIDASINMMSWVLVMIWLQDHISIW